MGVKQVTHQIAGSDVVLGAKQVRVLALENVAQFEAGEPLKPPLVKLRYVFFDELF